MTHQKELLGIITAFASLGRKALTKAIYDEVCRARRCVPSGTGLGEADKLLHLIDTYLDDEGTLESYNKQQDSLLERLRNAPISAVRDEQAIRLGLRPYPPCPLRARRRHHRIE